MGRTQKLALIIAIVLNSCASSAEMEAMSGRDSGAQVSSSELAIEWNRLLLSIAETEDRFLTLKGVRTAAMMHLAMHDALNAIDSRYETYTSAGETTTGANPVVAAAQAAYEVAVNQYASERAQLGEELDRWVGKFADNTSKKRALALGKTVAAAVLAQRANDGWDGEAEYMWHPMGPGVYAEFSEHSGTPEGFVFGAGWAAAKPFVLERNDQFRSLPPPKIDSDEYVEAFREVKKVGSFDSDTRTVDQTHLAMWWKDFVENSHNRLARNLAKRENLDLWETTRLFALLNVSVYDAYINVFENKFFYNHWRPYTAIRWAAKDGNPNTEPDVEWNNTHRHTYAFPSYPSAHGCASAAAMKVMADTFGNKTRFTMRTSKVDRAGPMSEKIEMDPPTRSFTSFEEAALECSMSRLYLGIHFRYDSVEGNVLGTRVGRHAVDNLLSPLGPGK